MYTLAATWSLFIVKGAGRWLNQFSFSKTHGEAITIGLIWLLIVVYLARLVHMPLFQPIAIEQDIGLWMLAVGVPWAICTLGLPMVLPRIWTAILAGLRDSAIQWLLTIVAAILSYGVFIMSQSYADTLIQSVVQTHPNQFPDAQRMLTAIFAICGWILAFYTVVLLALTATPMAKYIVTTELSEI